MNEFYFYKEIMYFTRKKKKKCCLTKGLNQEPSVPNATLITTRPWESVHDTQIKFRILYYFSVFVTNR